MKKSKFLWGTFFFTSIVGVFIFLFSVRQTPLVDSLDVNERSHEVSPTLIDAVDPYAKGSDSQYPSVRHLLDENARLRTQLEATRNMLAVVEKSLNSKAPLALKADSTNAAVEYDDLKTVDSRFREETVDAEWSVSAQRDVYHFAQTVGFVLLSVACRSETCKIQVEGKNRDKMELISREFGRFLPWATAIAIDDMENIENSAVIDIFFLRRI